MSDLSQKTKHTLLHQLITSGHAVHGHTGVTQKSLHISNLIFLSVCYTCSLHIKNQFYQLCCSLHSRATWEFGSTGSQDVEKIIKLLQLLETCEHGDCEKRN